MGKINVNQTVSKHRKELSVYIVYEMHCVQIVEFALVFLKPGVTNTQ